MSKMSDGGKGSSPRPFSVSQEEYNNRWDAIFGRDLKKEDNTGVQKNEYYDIITTEEALDELVRINQELGLYDMDPSENPLIKK
jgi:hypothetical protein